MCKARMGSYVDRIQVEKKNDGRLRNYFTTLGEKRGMVIPKF